MKLQRLTLLTLEQAGRVQTPAHPSESSKRSLDLQSLPVVVEKKVMWGLHSSIKKITNPTLKIALRFPSHAGGLNVMCLAGRLPKTLPGSSNAVAHQTILCFSLFPGCPASLPYSFFFPLLSFFSCQLCCIIVDLSQGFRHLFHFQLPSSLLSCRQSLSLLLSSFTRFPSRQFPSAIPF